MPQGSLISRRQFALAASAAASAAACRTNTAGPQPMPDSVNLTELSAVDAVRAMQRGELTAERYATALLDQCELGRNLNAFITFAREPVLTAARAADQLRKSGGKPGLLHG